MTVAPKVDIQTTGPGGAPDNRRLTRRIASFPIALIIGCGRRTATIRRSADKRTVAIADSRRCRPVMH